MTTIPKVDQAAEEFWLLDESTNCTTGSLSMFWISLSVISHNESTGRVYTAALISVKRIQSIVCNQSDGTSCRIIESISFPSALVNISKIGTGLFIDRLGGAGWLYVGADRGLYGLDLSALTIHPYLNGINESASSLA